MKFRLESHPRLKLIPGWNNSCERGLIDISNKLHDWIKFLIFKSHEEINNVFFTCVKSQFDKTSDFFQKSE